MNPDFVEMLRIAKERDVFVGLNSNAMLLTEPIARAMVELQQDLLMISFSGGTKETYERVITGANYERVLANLRRFNEIKRSAISDQRSAVSDQQSAVSSQYSALDIEQVKPVLELQYTAMRDNLQEIPDAVRLAIDLRCAGMVVMPLTVVNPSLEEQSILDSRTPLPARGGVRSCPRGCRYRLLPIRPATSITHHSSPITHLPRALADLLRPGRRHGELLLLQQPRPWRSQGAGRAGGLERGVVPAVQGADAVGGQAG